MAKDKQPFEALSETTEKQVEQNMERARGAMDNYIGFLQNICSPDLTEKMQTYTARNISASTECVRKLSQAKDFQEVFRIQTEFMQTQMNTFAEQARSLGEAYTKAATDATKPFRMSTWITLHHRDNPTIPSKKAARMGTRQSRQAWGSADGFAVCGFSATPAKYFDPLKRQRQRE
jgi:polyhydroxyalkanoate synthesis regulator protein